MSLAQFAHKTLQVAQNVSGSIRQAFRGKLNLSQTATPITRVQVSALADETLQDVEQFQQFGFTSHAPSGTEVIVLPLGGDTTHGIVVASENGAFRVQNLQAGEVAVYDQSGSKIVLKQGKLIEIDCDNLVINATQKVQINSPLTETSAVLTAQGQINGNGGLAIQGGSGARVLGSLKTTDDVVAGNISLQNHTHGGDSGGTTTTAR
ncbi:MAG: phage baseplate assembly protein V [Alysiella sp.]|uniref:phage baseplate assembly protein V n=1 Tax=Alysiella sp. TaxID=1872483 RepID=UPI0026DD9EB4|nr:phage baseplate assembly protein V [Alysiella sp.]MDO4434383.1 phage baseplate assembly protein V [Alysiella sp.]